jgi:hypothetical protein
MTTNARAFVDCPPKRDRQLLFVRLRASRLIQGFDKPRILEPDKKENGRSLSELIDPARPWVVPTQRGSDERPDLEDVHIDRRLRRRPDGGIKWVFDSDQEATAWTVETVWNASMHIMGSRTFHDMAAYWPTSTEVFAPPMNQIPKAVFSRQGPAILKPVNTTAVLRDARANAGPAGPRSCSPAVKIGRSPM